MTSSIRQKRMRSSVAIVVALLVVLTLGLNTTAHARGGQQWFTATGFSQQSLAPATEALTNATVRMIQRSTIAGNFVRVRLENTFGLDPLTIAKPSSGFGTRAPPSSTGRTVRSPSPGFRP